MGPVLLQVGVTRVLIGADGLKLLSLVLVLDFGVAVRVVQASLCRSHPLCLVRTRSSGRADFDALESLLGMLHGLVQVVHLHLNFLRRLGTRAVLPLCVGLLSPDTKR